MRNCAHRLSYNVNRTGHHHHAVGTSQSTCSRPEPGDIGGVFDHGASRAAASRISAGVAERGLSACVAMNSLRQRKQNLGDLADGLVAHGAEYEDQPAVFVGGRQRRPQGPGSSGIMGHIKNDLGPVCRARHDLEAARPRGLANAALDGIGGNGKPCWLSSSAAAIASATLRS